MKSKHLLKITLWTLSFLAVALFAAACSDEDTEKGAATEKMVRGVVLPLNSDVYLGMEFALKGSGFKEGDVISLEDGADKFDAQTQTVTEKSLVFIVPKGVQNEKMYKFILRREGKTQNLGHTQFALKLVANVQVPVEISAKWGESVTIQGMGFSDGDKLFVVQGAGEAEASVTAVTVGSITFTIPNDTADGDATILLRRGEQSQELGTTMFALSFSLDVPDKSGTNIKGVVYAGGNAMRNVAVSDGEKIVLTDENGYYWLNSTKKTKQVFVNMPAGYDAAFKNGFTEFFTDLTQDAATTEQHNFQLYPNEQNAFTFIVGTDMHLANRNTPKDYVQFNNTYVTEIKASYNSYSKKVFGLNCGDLSWDLYWYENSYKLPECKEWFSNFTFPTFSVMGNHDNDPYIIDDFAASESFRKVMNPRYYGFNVGEIQFIMLDNVLWKNLGGSQGVVGDREYSTGIDAPQLAWLTQYVKLLDPTKPTFVAFHLPAIAYNGVSGNEYRKGAVNSAMTSTLSLFSSFNEVHLLTGHTHVNRNISIDGYATSMREHNVVGVCGTWWWTNQYTASKNTVATDGSPAGYKVFDVNGRNISWHYKGLGIDRDKQFMTFDMNVVKDYWTNNANAKRAWVNLPIRAYDYLSVTENEVYINAWAFEQDSWSIKVTENGTTLPVTPVWKLDPLHSISYDIPRGVTTADLSFPSTSVPHLYSVKASSPTSSLVIEVTDKFGRKYTETMTRPKELTTYIR